MYIYIPTHTLCSLTSLGGEGVKVKRLRCVSVNHGLWSKCVLNVVLLSSECQRQTHVIHLRWFCFWRTAAHWLQPLFAHSYWLPAVTRERHHRNVSTCKSAVLSRSTWSAWSGRCLFGLLEPSGSPTWTSEDRRKDRDLVNSCK